MSQPQNPLQTALQTLGQTIQSVRGRISTLKTTYEQNQKQTLTNIAEINSLVDQISKHPNLFNKKLIEELRITKRDLVAATETLEKCEKERAQLKAQLDNLQKELEQERNKNVENQRIIDDLNRQLQQLNQQQTVLVDQINQLNQDLIKNLEDGLGEVNASFATGHQQTSQSLLALKTNIEVILSKLNNTELPPPPGLQPPGPTRGGARKSRKSKKSKKSRNNKKRSNKTKRRRQKGGYQYNDNKELNKLSSIISDNNTNTNSNTDNITNSRSKRHAKYYRKAHSKSKK